MCARRDLASVAPADLTVEDVERDLVFLGRVVPLDGGQRGGVVSQYLQVARNFLPALADAPTQYLRGGQQLGLG